MYKNDPDFQEKIWELVEDFRDEAQGQYPSFRMFLAKLLDLIEQAPSKLVVKHLILLKLPVLSIYLPYFGIKKDTDLIN